LKRHDSFQKIPNDFHRAITASEVISGIESSLRKIIKQKGEQKTLKL